MIKLQVEALLSISIVLSKCIELDVCDEWHWLYSYSKDSLSNKTYERWTNDHHWQDNIRMQSFADRNSCLFRCIRLDDDPILPSVFNMTNMTCLTTTWRKISTHWFVQYTYVDKWCVIQINLGQLKSAISSGSCIERQS
jgi:hypothetical protein